ncbi:DUF4167 domain-containing protein [Maricaulis sp. CAU 1757]
MKRQRGRGRKSGNSANRSYESNGPEVKIRGNAAQIYDKYLQLARDASSSGDRVRAENLYQHAEHYLRIVQANMPKRDANSDDTSDQDSSDDDSDDNDIDGNEQPQRQSRDNRDQREPRERRGRGNRQQRGGRDQNRGQGGDNEGKDPLNVVTPEGDQPSSRSDDKSDSSGEEKSGQPAGDEAPRRTRRPRRTKAQIEADKAAASEALEKASSADRAGGDDDGESEAA